MLCAMPVCAPLVRADFREQVRARREELGCRWPAELRERPLATESTRCELGLDDQSGSCGAARSIHSVPRIEE
jgi:hypothetical protein